MYAILIFLFDVPCMIMYCVNVVFEGFGMGLCRTSIRITGGIQHTQDITWKGHSMMWLDETVQWHIDYEFYKF